MEHYKLVADMNELEWFFNHVIVKPNFDEAYAFCMSSRHKKLTKEERQELGQGPEDEMLDPQVVFPGKHDEWDFNRWVKGILKYEVPVMAYTTRGGHPFLPKTLVVYCTPNPSDERNVVAQLKDYIAIHEKELVDSALKGSRVGVNESLYKLCHSLVKFKRLQFDCTGSRNWVDFDMDLTDAGKAVRDIIYKQWYDRATATFGKGNFVIVQTTGGYHTLVRKEILKFNPHKVTEQFCQDVGLECFDEFKYNNNCMLPTPGTYQYEKPVVVLNKKDFDD